MYRLTIDPGAMLALVPQPVEGKDADDLIASLQSAPLFGFAPDLSIIESAIESGSAQQGIYNLSVRELDIEK